jgi:uncharacterized protein YgiM (DUF1202 family)
MVSRSSTLVHRTPIRFVIAVLLAAALTMALHVTGSRTSAQSAPAFTAGQTVVVTTDGLNFRTEAGLETDVTSVLPLGTVGTVVAGPVQADGYTWYELNVAGTTGWSDAEYLAASTPVTATASFAAGTHVVVDTDALHLRASPGLDADILTTLASGDPATIISGPVQADGYAWYQVDTDAGTGWVAGDYLAQTVTASAVGGGPFAVNQAVVVATDALNLRAEAGLDSEVLAVLPQSTTGTVVGGPVPADGYTWYQVTVNGTTGWVAGEYLATDYS